MKINVTVKAKHMIPDFRPIIESECKKWGMRTVNKVKSDISGRKLDVVTGRLRSSIDSRVSQRGRHTKIKIGSFATYSEVPYAKIHDNTNPSNLGLGRRIQRIRPKARQFLTIPFDDTVKGKAIQYRNKFVKRSRGGKLILFQRVGKGKIKPLFILRKEVIIKGTGYLTENVVNRLPILEVGINTAIEARVYRI